ncbi:MAG TPA: serine/threonine-protein kinase [Gaiellaceae bacterium]|jgi:serine/threonine-protein kinase
MGDARYRQVRTLGGGGIVDVRLVEDEELRRPVVLRCLAEQAAGDDAVRRRFVREARLAASVAHPNVARVYDTGELDGLPFVAVEYVDGETLADVLARRGRQPEPEATQLVAQAAAGLAAVHAAGLVQGDVALDDLVLRTDGVLKLIGCGRTPSSEPLTAAADVHALGAVLYELLAGRPPQLEPLVTPVREHAPATSPEVERLVMRCLAGLSDRRPTAAEVAHALSGARDPEPRPAVRPRRRRLRLPALAALLVAAAAVAGAVITRNDAASPPAPPPARVTAVPHASTAAGQARNLSAWLRRYSR